MAEIWFDQETPTVLGTETIFCATIEHSEATTSADAIHVSYIIQMLGQNTLEKQSQPHVPVSLHSWVNTLTAYSHTDLSRVAASAKSSFDTLQEKPLEKL